MYGETVGLGRAESSGGYLSQDKTTTSQPLISVALESVGAAVKEVSDLVQMTGAVADGLVGALPPMPTRATNGEAVRQSPVLGRGGNLVHQCQELHEALIALRQQISRLHVL